jgi:DNA polymerase elongation subunit (family B)
MYSREKFKKFLFFDIETCGQHPNLQGLIDEKGPDAESIFKKKGQRLNNGKSWTGEPHTDYMNNVALFPEFGRIACLSYGIWKDGEMQIQTIADEDEATLLKKVANLFHKADSAGLIPTGWNIKNFDVSWIVRRLLMNGIQVPSCLSSYEKKPWEMNIFDMKEMWKSGSSLDVTFEEACFGMGVPTPKDDIDGSQVHATYWNGEIDRVVTYCEKDVKSMILLAEKIFNIYHPETVQTHVL